MAADRKERHLHRSRVLPFRISLSIARRNLLHAVEIGHLVFARWIKGGFRLFVAPDSRDLRSPATRRTWGEQNTGGISPFQNWIGGRHPGNAAFVPPSLEQMMECLDRFEHFLRDEKHKLPVLVEAGLIHVQFETIHPLLDRNGRLGRLLITLLLCAKDMLREPLLYLSLYFKTHASEAFMLCFL